MKMELIVSVLVLVMVSQVSIAYAAFRPASSSELRELQGASGTKLPSGTQIQDSDGCFTAGGQGHQGLESAGLKGKGNYGLNAEFAQKLDQLIKQFPGVTISSGYRDAAAEDARFKMKAASMGYQEARRWYPCPSCGDSTCSGQHHLGTAADLRYHGVKVRQGFCNARGGRAGILCQQVHQAAPGMGMSFCLPNEPWHIVSGGGNCGSQASSGGGSSGGSGGGGRPQQANFTPEELKELLEEGEVLPEDGILPLSAFENEDLEKVFKDASTPTYGEELASAPEPTSLSQRFQSLLNPEPTGPDEAFGDVEDDQSFFQKASTAVRGLFRGFFNPTTPPSSTPATAAPSEVQYASAQSRPSTYQTFCKWFGGCSI